MNTRFYLLVCSLVFTFSSVLRAQFIIVAQDEENIQELRNGSSLTVEADGIGSTATSRITVTFDGPDTSSALIGPPRLDGSRTFRLTPEVPLPVRIKTGESVDFTLSFSPTGPGPFSNFMTLNLQQTDIVIFQRGSFFREVEVTRDVDVGVNLEGLVPDYVVSFQVRGEGNETELRHGDVIQFPETEVDTTSSATITVKNEGSGAGSIERVALSGSAEFSISGLRLVPAELRAGSQFEFTVLFEPVAASASSAVVEFEFSFGKLTATLAGEGIEANLLHETVVDGVSTVISEGGTMTLPPTEVDEESSLTVQVTNTGALETAVDRISLSAPDFSLEDLPLLPAELQPGESLAFTLVFKPSEPGTSTGLLRIKDTSFTVEGEGLGAVIEYSLVTDADRIEVEPDETLVFGRIRIGEAVTAAFELTNTGNVARRIAAIGVAGDAFSLSGLPPLPLQLQPQQTASFTIVFEPDNVGPLSGSLAVGGETFPISGFGEELEELSAVTISGEGGLVPPVQQVAAAVSIAEPFPVDLVGGLALTFASEVFSDDPFVQFATGGRFVPFTIEAGETEAEFQTGAAQVFLQTGTIAGTIRLRAFFRSDLGRFDVTPDPIPELNFTIAREVPELLDLRISNLTTSSFTLEITGFATSRTVDQLEFQFTPAPGSDLQTTSLTADVSSPFTSWYSGGQSQSFGSAFTASINFNVDGDVSAISSVSATATNELGSSNPVSANVE